MYLLLLVAILILIFAFGIGIIRAVVLGFRLSWAEEKWVGGNKEPLLALLREALMADWVRFPARQYATALKIDMSVMVLYRLCQQAQTAFDVGLIEELNRDIADRTIIREMKGYLEEPDKTEHLTHFQHGRLGEHQKNLSDASKASELWNEGDDAHIAGLLEKRRNLLSGVLEGVEANQVTTDEPVDTDDASRDEPASRGDGFPFDELKNRFLAALRLDAETLKSVARTPSALNQSLVVVAIAAVAGSIAAGLNSGSFTHAVHMLATGLLSWVGHTAVSYLLAVRILFGQANCETVDNQSGHEGALKPPTPMDFPAYLRAMGFVWAPGPFLLLSAFPSIEFPVYLIFIVWLTAISSVLLRLAFNVPTSRAVLVAVGGVLGGFFVGNLLAAPIRMLIAFF